MKAPRNPAAMETALRLEEEMLLVTPELCCQNFSMRMKGMNGYGLGKNWYQNYRFLKYSTRSNIELCVFLP